MERRERLIKFIENFYSGWDCIKTVFHGYGRRGIQITFNDLTDDALERLADQLRRDFWRSRRMNRENRARIQEAARRTA